MTNEQPDRQVSFYVPSADVVRGVPASIDDYWNWIDGAVKQSPALLGNGAGPCTWLGPYNWTIQTFLYLSAAGVPCSLSARMPDAGIVVAHGDFLPPSLMPSEHRFVVEIKPDRPLQCRHANFVIVQNANDPLRTGLARVLVPSAFVNYWPQPGLLARDPARGDRFENVCFMGNTEQFLPETDLVESELRALGLRWRLVPRNEWHDYRSVDAVVAVRPLNAVASKAKEHRAFFAPDSKPASKLLNAWMAGVPAVLSPESAFKALRRSDLDYLEAGTVEEIVAAVRRLRADKALCRAMRDNGLARARLYTPDQTSAAWRALLEHRIVPSFHRWQRSSIRRRWLPVSRRILARTGSV